MFVAPWFEQKDTLQQQGTIEYPRVQSSSVQLRRLKRHQSQLANTTNTQTFRMSPYPNNSTINKSTIGSDDLAVVASTLQEKKQFETKKSSNVFIMKGKKNLHKKKIGGQSPDRERSGNRIPGQSYRKEDLSFEDLMKLYGVTLTQYSDPKQEVPKVLQPKTFYNSQRGIFRILSMNTREDTEENSQQPLISQQRNITTNSSANNYNNTRCSSVQRMRNFVDEMKTRKSPLPTTNREQILSQLANSMQATYRSRSHTAATANQLFGDNKQSSINDQNKQNEINVLEAYYNLKEKDLFDTLTSKQSKSSNTNHRTHHPSNQQQDISEWSKIEYSKNRNDYLIDQKEQSSIQHIQQNRSSSSSATRIPLKQKIQQDEKRLASDKGSIKQQQFQPYMNIIENSKKAQSSHPLVNIKIGNLMKRQSKSDLSKTDYINEYQITERDQMSPRLQKYPNQSSVNINNSINNNHNNSGNKKVLQNQQTNIYKVNSPQSEEKKQIMIQDYKESIEKIHHLQSIKLQKNDTQSIHAKRLADSISTQTLNQWSEIAKKRKEQENQSLPLPAFYITKKVFNKPSHIIPVDQYTRLPGNFKTMNATPQKDELEEYL